MHCDIKEKYTYPTTLQNTQNNDNNSVL